MVNQSHLIKALSKISPKTVLVVGDLILDCYTYGVSKRISPEAPVPVVLVQSKKAQAGGSGNVVLNLQAVGMQSRIVSCVGADSDGKILQAILEEARVDCRFLSTDASMKTPVKTRIIAGSQQIVRIDEEECKPLSISIENRVREEIEEILNGVAVIAISDYAKGFLSESLLQFFISEARERSIPCITDPKGTDFRKYMGSTIIKPNAHEAMAAFGGGFATLEEAVLRIFTEVDVEMLLVTRAEAGISIYFRDGRNTLYPVAPKAVRDVTGAGDTVLAILASSIASSIPLDEAIPLANIAASCAIEQIGCASVTLQDMVLRLLDENPTGKLCDIDTFNAVMRAFRPELVVIIAFKCQEKALSPQAIIQLQQLLLEKPKERIAVAYIDDAHPCEELLQFLTSLDRIDLVVHKKELIQPDAITTHGIAVHTIT
ncbi:MAG: bifunctional ADP-heptose synthase [Chlamydia sp.]